MAVIAGVAAVAAGVRALFDLSPVAGPGLAPHHLAATGHTSLARQGLLVAFETGVDCHDNIVGCKRSRRRASMTTPFSDKDRSMQFGDTSMLAHDLATSLAPGEAMG